MAAPAAATPGATGLPIDPSDDQTLISTGAGRSLQPAPSHSDVGGSPSGGYAGVGHGGSTGSRIGPSPPIFNPGDHVANRYRIVRFIAQGGMGEVYEAEDLELRQEVALKTVSTHLGEEAGAVDRFKREIALARRVTHPNVCRIFDLGQHLHEPSSPPEGGLPPAPIVFLSMELLRGETLAQRLRSCSRLQPSEAKPLVEQMAEALHAAHSARVVHRDFKSENVFLVPENDPETGGARIRVVVTDFGIARGSDASDRFAAQVTGLGIVGTPAYMAPEQVRNDPAITPAADIYALGIVIYEMVTGKLPFESTNPLTTAVKRLQEEPQPPHVHVPDLPAYWERAILKCLQLKPEDRFASVLDVAEALKPPQRRRLSPEPSSKPASPPAPAQGLSAVTEAHPKSKASLPSAKPAASPHEFPGPPPSAAADRRAPILIAVLLVVLAISGVLWWNNRETLDPGRVKLRRAIAVWGFDNVTGRDESAWIGTALLEMVSTELAKSRDLRGVSSQEMAEARRQLAWTQGEPSAKKLEAIRRLTGSDFVVSGSFVSLPGSEADAKLRLDFRLQDATRGGTLAQFSKEGSTSDLFAMVSELGGELLSELGSSGLADGDSGLPRNTQAAKLYAEALTALREFQAEEARDLLEQATQLEPDNPLVHSALSSAWGALGFKKQAAKAAERAFNLSSGLPQEERLVIEGRYREMRSQGSAARDVYRTLWQAFPDQLDYGLALVSAQLAAHDPQAALLTIDQLRRLPPPLSDDPRIDLREATAAGTVSQIERQATAAGRAVAKAEISGSQLILARALLSRSQAERLMGRPDEAAKSAARARQAFEDLSHTPGQANALSALAAAQLDQGLAEPAAEGYHSALEIHRELGNRGGQAATLNNLAVIRKRAGDLDGAEDLYRETEAIYREVGDARGMALTVNNRAVILVDRDQLSEALTMFEGAQQTWEKMGGPAKAYALNNIAEVYRLQGQLAKSLENHNEALRLRRAAGLKLDMVISQANLGALHLMRGDLDASSNALDEALKLAKQTGDPTATALVHFYTGDLHREAGDLESAQGSHQQAYDLRSDLGQSGLLTSSRIGLARVAAELKSYDEAARLASQARISCQLDDRPAEEIAAATILAESLDQLGRGSEVDTVLEETKPLAIESQQPMVRIAFERMEALLEPQTEPETRLARLDSLAAEAQALGFVSLELELRTDWGEIAVEFLPEEARKKLIGARDEAERRGFGRIAERASLVLDEFL